MTLSPIRKIGFKVTECDHFGIDMIHTAATGPSAATTAGIFSATVGTGQEWLN